MALKPLWAGVAVIGLMAQPALAQTQDTTGQQRQAAPSGAQQQLAQQDIKFAKEAAQGGLKEVEFGRLAQQQAKSEEVQQFGQRMVEDHGKANDQLKQIAQNKGVELPQQLSDKAQQTYDELQQKSGAEFDQAYMDEMVSDHQEDVDKFQQYVDQGQDSDLTSFAEKTLPTLKEHLQLAQKTQEQVTASSGEMEQPDAAIATGQQHAATQPQGAISIEEVLGSQVVNSAGEDVAEIEDVVMGRDQKYYAVLSVGGFLGIGEKKVAIPLDELQLGEDQTYLMSATTEEQLEQMPEYDAKQYQPFQRG